MNDSPVAVALSGGLDSLMAARLLAESGARLMGLHFSTGFSPVPPDIGPQLERLVTSGLSPAPAITVHGIDLSSGFRRHVVDYFIASYRSGRTPNPCLRCNPAVKFGLLLDAARSLGAETLATGHYARIAHDPDSGRRRLFRGVDRRKDQSYFLAFLSQSQLAAARFPLGGLTKGEVRRMAAERGLAPMEKEESQDVCFIRGEYADFLSAHGVESRPGPIEDDGGRLIGTHQGLHRFTVGQRKGINVPASEPYYVVRLDVARNCLVVGFKDAVYADACRVSGIHWIAPVPLSPFRASVRLRYRHEAVPAEVIPSPSATGSDSNAGFTSALVRFDAPQQAVTPGQGAVFYDGDEVLGGGWIHAPSDCQ